LEIGRRTEQTVMVLILGLMVRLVSLTY
jgi:hypothetical protein